MTAGVGRAAMEELVCVEIKREGIEKAPLMKYYAAL